ncbi:MAG: AIDA repeat-containing protein [Lentisphaeria bacterium]|nr:AIDA repeat-containing protein [Lentisphaeria bacterium]
MSEYHVSDGQTSTGLVLNNDSMYVSLGGTAVETTVNTGGSMYVYEGGVADNTVNNGGRMYLKGGTANYTTLNDDGRLNVSAGGVANSVTVNTGNGSGHYGGLWGYDGGSANNVTVNEDGFVRVSAGGIVTNIVENGGYVHLPEEWDGGQPNVTFLPNSFSGLVLNSKWTTVHSGTTATDMTVNSEGAFHVFSGGTANKAIINSGGSMAVINGKADDLTVNSGGGLFVYSNGIANNITVNEGANSNGGSGGLWVSSGGSVNNVLVNGYLRIESDGFATDIVENGGYVYLSEDWKGGQQNVTFLPNSFSGLVLDGSWATVHSGTTATDMTVNSDGLFQIISGGTANNATVNNGGKMEVFSGKADDLTVNDGGRLYVYSGGIANNVSLKGDGHFVVYSNGVVNSAIINGGVESGGFLISAGASANDIAVDGGYFEIRSACTANWVTVNSDGRVHLTESGALANDVEVNYSGYIMIYSGAKATNVVENGGYVKVADGGHAEFLSNSFSGLALNGAWATVHSGTTATDTTVNSDGFFRIFSGGIADGFTVTSGGSLSIRNRAVLTGKITIEDGATVEPPEDADLYFDLTRTSAGADPLVNDLSYIPNSFLFFLTVDGTEEIEAYSLADGAAAFDSTITVVNTAGTELGTLTAGDESKLLDDNRLYTLTLDGSSLAVTIIALNGPEEPLNNYLYDKKLDPALNTEVSEEYGTYIRTAHDEICLDKIGTVDSGGYHNHVGADDEYDFAKITLEHGARVSFDLFATDATKFRVWSLTSGTDKKTGATTYKQKSLQATTLKKAKGATEYAAQTKNLFLEAGVYYVSMQSTNAKKGGDAYYDVTLNGEIASKNSTVIYADGDDGRNNWLYDKKTRTVNPDRFDFETTHITSGTSEVLLDSATSHADETGTWKNFAGFGDAADFARIQLDCGASVTFTADAEDASKFTIWKLTEGTDKKGNITYTQKSLQATTLKKAKGATAYSAGTKKILLEAGEYYISMQSTNAKKGGNAYYSVTFDEDESVFYSDADGGWNNYLYDSKTKTLNPYKDYFKNTDISAGTEARLDSDTEYYDGETLWHNFAGFTDAADFAQITLNSDATLSFTLTATDAAKFTIWRLDTGTDKKGNTTYTQKSLQATTLKKDKETELFMAETKLLSLDAGVYYVSMESTNAAKGGCAYYDVRVNDASVFSKSPEPKAALAMAGSTDSTFTGLAAETSGLLA